MKKKLQEWFMDNIPEDKMLWKNAMADQVIFIRDKIYRAFPIKTKEDYSKFKEALSVISTHTSKSVVLPVYNIYWGGITFILRENFYDWKVSVISSKPIDIDFKPFRLFDPEKQISPVYCEGFMDEWVFGPYTNNNKKFTIEIQDDFDLFCFFKIMFASN